MHCYYVICSYFCSSFIFFFFFFFYIFCFFFFFFFSSRRRHTRCGRDWSSDVCSSDLLNGVLIDRFQPEERTGYPTLCKGRFEVAGEVYHPLEEPTSLNTLDLLPQLYKEGIKSLKIEGRQRSPAYVAQITRVWRAAIDSVLAAPESFTVDADWQRV